MLAGQRSKTPSAVALATALAVASWAWAQGHGDHGQTLRQLIDLVAYLKSQTTGAMGH